MTYCLGILIPSGLVLAADSRSNAGVDQITRVHKLALITRPGERVIAVLSAGNLATTQYVVTSLQEALGSGDLQHDLYTARTMFDAANMLGGKLREVIDRENRYVQPYGDPSASFLIRPQEPKRIKIEDIQRVVARQYNVSRSDLLSSRRTANVVRPRQVAMYLAKTLTLRSLPEIGRRFGGRDHTTVLHAVRKIEALVSKDIALSEEVESLKRQLQE